MDKIALGGGCHWCTEAVFQSLKGVEEVQQGYVSSTGINNGFSEAVIVVYNKQLIPLETLIEIHLRTHQSMVNHSRRETYRSAIYIFNSLQKQFVKSILEKIQPKFKNTIITKVLAFKDFKASREEIRDYYIKNPQKPFCKKYIDPKLDLLKEEFTNFVRN